MKIILKDFGPISHFEFDLEKDLHVIFGKNNIGKSYAISAVYLILKYLIGKDANQQRFTSYLFNEEAKIIDNMIYENRKEYEYIDITNRIEGALGRGILEGVFANNLTSSFKNSFLPQLDQLSNKRSQNKLNLDLQFNGFKVTISYNEQLNLLYSEKVQINVPIQIKRKEKGSFQNGFYTLLYNNHEKDFYSISDCIEDLYVDIILKELSLINNVYFLPAYRSGYYLGLNSLSPIIAELSKSRNLITQKIGLPAIPEPVADYFRNTTAIGNRTKNNLETIIETIEKSILKGTVLFNEDNKKIVFKEDATGLELDLAFTSSMVSEISLIVACLKNIIGEEENSIDKTYSILFIEEPEAHLHPEVQVKLMEIFAMLTGSKLKIVMTSHSNYMFNKLSNLILDGKVDYNKVSSYIMRNTDIGSVADMVSMKAEEDGMNDDNFADVAEMLYNERIAIYDKLNNAQPHAD